GSNNTPTIIRNANAYKTMLGFPTDISLVAINASVISRKKLPYMLYAQISQNASKNLKKINIFINSVLYIKINYGIIWISMKKEKE
ncbi:MAG: hypothetical protein K2N53_00145, partial [Clostridia bacterium]|nr:hypothetical protein [Clostridia bacterium]